MTTEVIITNLGPKKIVVDAPNGYRREVGVRATVYLNCWDGNAVQIKEIPE